jgi:hypothetical protein
LEALVICVGSLLFALLLHRLALRSSPVSRGTKDKKKEVDWVDLARPLFLEYQASPSIAEEKIDSVLMAGLERLKLRQAHVLEVGDTDSWRILASVSIESTYQSEQLKAGQSVNADSLYCGQLRHQDSIYIEFAGFSRWRTHKSYRERGWETYLGTRRVLQNGTTITLAFLDNAPREKFFSAAEREIVQKSAQWVALLLDRKNGALLESDISSGNFGEHSNVAIFPTR